MFGQESPRPFSPWLRHSTLAGYSSHPRSDSLEMGLGQAVLKSGLGARMQSSFPGLCGTDCRSEVATASKVSKLVWPELLDSALKSS